MSRSIARQCLAPGTTVPPGEVLVATEVGDPSGGLLACPAAPLVGGTLRRRGVRVSYAPVPRCGDASPLDDGATLFVTSALQRDGTATAIGAGANSMDAVALAAARAAVEEWSAVVGTRRLLDAVSPWCRGAAQALQQVQQALMASGTVYVYGRIAASPQVCAQLEKEGAVFTDSLEDIPNGSTVLIPAHGAAPEVRDEATGRGLAVVDATCPLVAGAQAEVQRFAERGDQVVLIGQASHAVVAGILGQAPGRSIIVGSPASTGVVSAADPRRVSYLLQPGIPVEDTTPVAAALRSRFPALRGPDPDAFCYAASDRTETARSVAASCDVVLVLGAADDADTRYLTGLARSCHAKAHAIADVTEIAAAWLAGTSAIGLAETTSAAPGLAAQVAQALSGLGPLSVTRRQVTTEIQVRRKQAGRRPGRRPVTAGRDRPR
jgi:4-hydroxy-3-methylbut-2-en-1-yl diphosphate reductase